MIPRSPSTVRWCPELCVTRMRTKRTAQIALAGGLDLYLPGNAQRAFRIHVVDRQPGGKKSQLFPPGPARPGEPPRRAPLDAAESASAAVFSSITTPKSLAAAADAADIRHGHSLLTAARALIGIYHEGDERAAGPSTFLASRLATSNAVRLAWTLSCALRCGAGAVCGVSPATGETRAARSRGSRWQVWHHRWTISCCAARQEPASRGRLPAASAAQQLVERGEVERGQDELGKPERRCEGASARQPADTASTRPRPARRTLSGRTT